MNNLRTVAARGLAGVGALLLLTTAGRADPVLDWNDALLRATRAARANPPVGSRAMAIAHAAIFDAANGIQRTHRPYHVTALAPAGASLEAAIAAAGHTAALALYANPDIQQTNFTALYNASIAAIPDGAPKTDGLAWGRSVAEALLALRATDGWTNVVPYTQPPDPGIWRPTPPANAAPLLPGWGQVTPFTMTRGSQFRPHRPPNLTSSAYALEYDLVRRLGAKEGSIRTADQDQIALFWADNPGTETPPGHWNHIAADVSRSQSLTILQNARLFALLNLALADAAISCWDAKFAYNLWRPISAIREAESDGNPNTPADPAWESFIPTPAFPEYTSGHSTFSRSAATVLATFLGRDDLAFTSVSDGLPGVTRHYPGFSAAADESGISRIYGGIHWPSANIAAQTVGFMLANHVTQYFLAPLNAPVFGLIKVTGQTVDLTLSGETGRSYLIQGSSDLDRWTDVATATAVDGAVHVQDNTPTPFKFYRAQAL